MGKIFTTEHIFEGYRYFGTLIFFALLLAFLQTSCNPGAEKVAAVKDQGITKNYARDFLTLTLRINKKEISIAEQLELDLETGVPENVAVEFPTYSAGLGDFTLKDTRILPGRMTGSGEAVRIMHQATYLLEPYLSGTYTIPAMEVIYRDRKNSTEFTRLVTEELQIQVQSLLGPDSATLEIKDIAPPLALKPDRILQFLAGGLILLLAALALSGFLYWKNKAGKKFTAAVQLQPEEIALRELDRLLADDLLSSGALKLFHLRISDILRRYIENRFGLKAPERTTEEFLLELSRTKSSEDNPLGSYKPLLTAFLNQCDLVKFARYEPSLAESEKTVVICREFIEKTKGKGEREKAKG